MTDQIISRDLIRRKARNAFAAGLPRHAHNMNPSEALNDWLDEYDRCAAAHHLGLADPRQLPLIGKER